MFMKFKDNQKSGETNSKPLPSHLMNFQESYFIVRNVNTVKFVK